LFGENSNSAIIIISATSTNVGTIIHTNDEIEYVLGYKRREVIGKNISLIMPRPIARVHDLFIHRYFETAKPTVIDI
jgi:PAS domain S-box-containing protein